MLTVTLSTFVELVFLCPDNKLKEAGSGGGRPGVRGGRRGGLKMFGSNFRMKSIHRDQSKVGGCHSQIQKYHILSAFPQKTRTSTFITANSSLLILSLSHPILAGVRSERS